MEPTRYRSRSQYGTPPSTGSNSPPRRRPDPINLRRDARPHIQRVYVPSRPHASEGSNDLRQGETLRDFLNSTAETSDGARYMSGRYGQSMAGASSSTAARPPTLRHGSSGVSTQSPSRKRVSSDSFSLSGRHPPAMPLAAASTVPLGSGQSMEDPVDLISPPRSRRQLAIPRRESSSRSNSNIVLPGWQPDDEVITCPVCDTAFNWYYRKHHCRKCGKVVCANCSMHRITIPRQFIVHSPPNTSRTAQQEQRGGVGTGVSGEPSGGVTVRMCNPCVPDPNPNPPPQQGPEASRSSILLSHPRNRSLLSRRNQSLDSNLPPNLHRNEHDASRILSSLTQSRADSSSQPGQPFGTYQPDSTLPRPHISTIQLPGPRSQRNSLSRPPHSILPLPPISTIQLPGPRSQRHSLGHPPHATTPSARGPYRDPRRSHYPDHRHDQTAHGTSAPAVPATTTQPRLIHESDQCPICRRALPPLDPNTGSDELRTGHIVRCITRAERRHSGIGTSQGSVGTASAAPNPISGSLDAPPPYPGSMSSASFMNAHQAPSSRWNLAASRLSSQREYELAARIRQQHEDDNNDDHEADDDDPLCPLEDMLRFRASAGDCINWDEKAGPPPECVICFEEFEEGQELGRLECLCKFHAVSVFLPPF